MPRVRHLPSTLPLAVIMALVLSGLGLLVVGLLGVPRKEALTFAVTMPLSGLGTLVLALALIRVAERSPRIGIGARMLIPIALAITVLLINIGLVASLMFIKRHDVVILAVLLCFAGGLAFLAAVPLANSITGGLDGLTAAVGRMAGGDAMVRVQVETADEVGALGAAFNAMAERVEQANRQRAEMDEARRTLLAAVSHDLRTPLSAIRVMLEAIEDGVVDDPQTVERYHRAMQAEVMRLSTLIDDLFELTQIEAGALRLSIRPTDLGELIGEMVDAMRAEAERAGVQFVVDVTPDVRSLPADPQLLHRVLRNLVTNALRHTPPDGTVMLRAEARDGGVAVTVADTGEGIAAEDLPHVFERFYRGDKSRSRAGGGAGLGLSIARGIVEAHGGQIAVDSRRGQGTTFTIILPSVS